jgi:hypothetical protein
MGIGEHSGDRFVDKAVVYTIATEDRLNLMRNGK